MSHELKLLQAQQAVRLVSLDFPILLEFGFILFLMSYQYAALYLFSIIFYSIEHFVKLLIIML